MSKHSDAGVGEIFRIARQKAATVRGCAPSDLLRQGEQRLEAAPEKKTEARVQPLPRRAPSIKREAK
jgi:hypothetical protein